MSLDFIQKGLNIVVNKYWKLIIRSRLVLDEIYCDKNHVGTLWVIDINHVLKYQCYLIIAINRAVRTIICTTTKGHSLDCRLFQKLSNMNDDGHYFACVSLRLFCEQNHEPFIIYLADIFSNETYSPLSTILSDNDILKKYNIIATNEEKQAHLKKHL